MSLIDPMKGEKSMLKKENRKSSHFKLLLGIGMISTSLFMYEIVLSRLFSTILPYHFAFLILSTAILGMGMGSIVELKKMKKSGYNDSQAVNHSTLLLLLSWSMLGSFMFMYFMPFMSVIYVYIGIAAIPYIFAGRFFTNLFTTYGNLSNEIYFSDLVGAGLASILCIGIFYYIGFVFSINIIFILIFLSSLIFSMNSEKNSHMVLSGGAVIFFMVASLTMNTTSFLEDNFTAYMTSPFTSLTRMRNSGGNAEVTYTKWDGFARTDVIEIEEIQDYRIVSTNGSANTLMIRYDGKNDFYDLRKKIDYIPYLLKDEPKVAIIGAGGGRDVLQAIIGGAKVVDAMEINRSTVEAVRDMGDFNGNIYENPRVNVIIGDGRSILEKSNKKYDIIFISMVMTGAAQASGYALAESYIYTEEAFQTYYNHLTPDGKIVFVGHNTMDMQKIANTSLRLLEDNNIASENFKDHIFIGGTKHESMLHTPLIMVSKLPYLSEEVSIIKDFFGINKYSILNLSGTEYKNYISEISEGKTSLDKVIRGSEYEVKPSTDNTPFFYNFQRGIPPVFGLILIIIFVFTSIYFRGYLREREIRDGAVQFSLLGMGFMLVEVSLIQKMTIYLEHPTTAFVTTISTLLIGAGIGSFFSNKKLYVREDGRHYGALASMVSIISTLILVTLFHESTFSLSLTIKLLIAIPILFVNGFFMGMIFPYSLSTIKNLGREEHIPIFYGINGIFSMIGSIAAILISMKIGITAALLSGGIIYGVIYALMPKLLWIRSYEVMRILQGKKLTKNL